MAAGTLGFRATGHVTREEYRDLLLPAMKEAAEAGEVRMVFAAHHNAAHPAAADGVVPDVAGR
jgi:hypothetical protein